LIAGGRRIPSGLSSGARIAFFPFPHPVFIVIHETVPFLSLPAMPVAFRIAFHFGKDLYKLYGYKFTIKKYEFKRPRGGFFLWHSTSA
jgi:hypothetical protein